MTAVTIDDVCHELSGAPWLEPCPDAEQVAVLTAAREPFVHTSLANRVVFGWGTAEAVAEEVARLDRAADLATRKPYWNPKPFDRRDIRRLIAAAYEGRPPEG